MKLKAIWHKVLYFPLTKMIVGLIVILGIISFGQWGVQQILGTFTLEKEVSGLITGMVTATLALLSYSLLFRFYENRVIAELATTGLLRNLSTGFLLGALLQTLTIGVIWSKGGFSIITMNPVSFLIGPFTMAFTSAIIEEILVRGIIFRILEEKLGSYIALFISAAIFGALHLANPNSTMIAAIGLALQAGLFLAAAYMYTRNLWFPIAIHFAWNFTQAGIFGASVSGNPVSKSLFTSHIEGSDWYTGGAFGPEGSVQATVFCLMATAVIIVLIHKQHKVVLPFWKRKESSQLPG